ncbi:MAG: glycosyltransferase family 2 protein [Alphaproteobacteria bacterium]|nr:glycosyltransferase family 2 protein [Alphaproteobacteria bacterium]
MTEVSFVVTVFNKSKFIPQVTRAILAQRDVGPCEYIFVDDGSTDDSLDVLRKHTQGVENVNIISQKNAGPALATNRGIEAVSSPYIKFVDGDDILHPLSASELLKAVKNLGVDMAYSLGEEVPSNSDKMDAPDTPLSGEAPRLIDDPLEAVTKKALFNLTCVLAKTEAVRSMGGCDPRVFIQDYSFALRMAERSKFALVPSILNWAPVDVDNRASGLGGGAQVLHDLNAALGYFVADHPELDGKLKARMLQRAAGRAWKWAKREAGHSMLSEHFRQYLWAHISPLSGDVSQRLLGTCEAFHQQGRVRIP